jgi:hypothetical protein
MIKIKNIQNVSLSDMEKYILDFLLYIRCAEFALSKKNLLIQTAFNCIDQPKHTH